MNYQQQATDFADQHGLELTILSNRWGKHFADDKESRNIYKCRLSRGHKSYTFDFGASITDPKAPTMYDILSCVQKYEPGTFENFCANFGYDISCRSSARIYKAVCKEYESLVRVCGSRVVEAMQEIQ